jgi:hypothetical protein
MARRGGAAGEAPGALQDDVHLVPRPRDALRLALAEARNAAPAHRKRPLRRGDGRLEGTVEGVVPQEMRQDGRGRDIVQSGDGDVRGVPGAAQEAASDSPQTVDADPDRHETREYT